MGINQKKKKEKNGKKGWKGLAKSEKLGTNSNDPLNLFPRAGNTQPKKGHHKKECRKREQV